MAEVEFRRRQRIMEKCRQVTGITPALRPHPIQRIESAGRKGRKGRLCLGKREEIATSKKNLGPSWRFLSKVFVESICDNKEILERNYSLKLANDDYRAMDPVKAKIDFLKRVEEYKSRYQTVSDLEDDGEICYIKLFNVGQKAE
ncbi:unnamed protein product [Effrenium voratum]|uniref:6-phosphofructo-2-kinase domain-containing protein n=1 Tax=Effrenium voratum TaxID=2562239 RepID=A0AA36J8N0_9DINO|nr:unnamed protein product [Effrenium voratum]